MAGSSFAALAPPRTRAVFNCATVAVTALHDTAVVQTYAPSGFTLSVAAYVDASYRLCVQRAGAPEYHVRSVAHLAAALGAALGDVVLAPASVHVYLRAQQTKGEALAMALLRAFEWRCADDEDRAEGKVAGA